MSLVCVLPSEAHEKEVYLPETEWIKLLAFVDKCKQDHSLHEKKIKLLVNINKEQKEVIAQAESLMDTMEVNGTTRDSVENKLEELLKEKDAQVAQEYRYGWYKSGGLFVIGGILGWLLF